MNHIDELFDSIYGDLNGAFIVPASPFPVENAFAEGEPCEVLYGEVCDLKVGIYDRLGINDDPDVERIIDALLEITDILSRKMFEYGMKVQESHL